MAVQLGDETVKVRLDISGDIITFHHRPYHDQVMAEAMKKLLKTRFTLSAAGDPTDHSVEARRKFFDETVISVEGAEWKGVPIGPNMDVEAIHSNGGPSVDRWTDLIPINWKTAVATFFEEKRVQARDAIEKD